MDSSFFVQFFLVVFSSSSLFQYVFFLLAKNLFISYECGSAYGWYAWRMFICGVTQWGKRADMKKSSPKKKTEKHNTHKKRTAFMNMKLLSVGLYTDINERSINQAREKMITVWRCTERKKRWTSYNDYDATIQQWRWSQCFSPKMVMVQRHILQSVYLQPLIIIYVPIRLCKSRVSRITIYHMRQRQSERVRASIKRHILLRYRIPQTDSKPNYIFQHKRFH